MNIRTGGKEEKGGGGKEGRKWEIGVEDEEGPRRRERGGRREENKALAGQTMAWNYIGHIGCVGCIGCIGCIG